MTGESRMRGIFSTPVIRFLGAGLLNTLFGYAVFALLIFLKLPYLTALLLATVAGIIFNYFSFGQIVFNGHGGKLVFVRFIVAYGIIYAANAVLLDLLVKHLVHNSYLAQALCVPPSVVLSWILMNRWVYKKRD